MSEQNVNDLKVPILKKDASVMIELGYSEISAIVNALFVVASLWSPQEVESFRQLIEKREQTTDTKQLIYLILDNLYRKILKQAQEEGKTEQVSVSEATSPLGA